MKRMTTLATIASSVILGTAVAHAGDQYGADKHAGDKAAYQEQFKAADTDRDGALTLAEAQAGLPKLAEKFTSVDTNGDGKVSADEMKAHKDKKRMEADQSVQQDPAKQSESSQ